MSQLLDNTNQKVAKKKNRIKTVLWKVFKFFILKTIKFLLWWFFDGDAS
jgi:hypothetical protein